ncbi:MAG: 4-hydroxy-3-methylbut-2-en-1-yl diphosphate synthase [Nitrospinota bacterium]|nr:MAG: 4-hydroxy-3-methylbut-2-en-1-yl diphosphate synthase [Nitrospinota bacterium]
MLVQPPYCANPFAYTRRKTRVVYVGDVAIGGDNPIRVQSMTTADTCDTRAVVEEITRLVEVGCEIVRLTVPSLRDAENLKNIKEALKKRGIRVPLVADIHFTPNAALKAVEYVEKVRVNPGNYADRKHFTVQEYSDEEYRRELERIEERFKPLVLKARQYGVAMRIGTNHGSLSDRIMNRYGDTPEGMVESALEFVRICERYDYHDIILSMKASNPQVTIQAYRLLAARMQELGMDYPFHLGVTEAGDGEDGRIKSAIGIGALLEDGIGDTIRVSLTEAPEAEVPVAFALVKKYNERIAQQRAGKQDALPVLLTRRPEGRIEIEEPRNFYAYQRRETRVVHVGTVSIGGKELVRVELATQTPLKDVEGTLAEIRQLVDPLRPEAPQSEIVQLRLTDETELEALRTVTSSLRQQGISSPLSLEVCSHPELALQALPLVQKLNLTPTPQKEREAWQEEVSCLIRAARQAHLPLQWNLGLATIPRHLVRRYGETLEGIAMTAAELIALCRAESYDDILFALDVPEVVAANRLLVAEMHRRGARYPLLLKTSPLSAEEALLQSAVELGSLLCDGIGDAIQIRAPLPPADLIRLSFNILQGTRLRLSKTEFISCPSCGRTLFDLQTTTERIKAKTGHLKGVKIAIMGCIVNGLGEMADADFGYVGAGPGKINLFVGKECVERHIPTHLADEKLIELIKAHGKWREPETGQE